MGSQDGTGTAYINEMPLSIKIRPKRNIHKKGDAVFSEDIADIQKLRMHNVTIPPEAGFLILFSVGWRKGLFYDFEPLDGPERDFDVELLLGQYYAYLSRQGLFKITETEWECLMEQRWFPFIFPERRDG